MTPLARIELPFPPSNHDVFGRHNGKNLSDDYRKWRDAAGWLLASQRPAKLTGRVDVIIELVPPDARLRDIDNFTKAPIDLLVAHRVIEKDDVRIVRQVTARWCETGPACVVIVDVAGGAPDAPPSPRPCLSTVGLTVKQGEALLFIDDYCARTGRSPTLTEIGEALSLNSKSSVHRLLQGLEDRRRIKRLPNKARAIVIVEARP